MKFRRAGFAASAGMDDELVRPTLERLRHGPIDPHVEVVSYDSDDRPVRSLASKALGTIERMARKGTISDQMADAAERFRSDFRTGALQTLRASAMREPIGSTRAPLLPRTSGITRPRLAIASSR